MNSIIIHTDTPETYHLFQQLAAKLGLAYEKRGEVEKKTGSAVRKPKRPWAGSLSRATSRKMLDYIQKSRNEWERI